MMFNLKLIAGITIAVLGMLGLFGGSALNLFGTIKDEIEGYLNNDGLLSTSGKKFILRNKGNSIFVFADIDCTDISLEKSKIMLYYNWREFIEASTKYKTTMVLTFINESESAVNEMLSYIDSFNNSVKSINKSELKICIAEGGRFKSKYKIPAGSSVVFMDKKHRARVHKLGSYYMHLYSVPTILFIEELSPIFGPMMKKIYAEPGFVANTKFNSEDMANLDF